MADTEAPSTQFLVEAFAERARAVVAEVTQVASIEEAAQVIASSEHPTTSELYTASAAILSACPDLRPALEASGIQLRVAEEVASTEGPSETARRLAGDVGIVLAVAGVAETGSFLSAEESLAARLLSMLADTLFAVVPATSIVPTLDEMGVIISDRSAQGGRYLSLITGPSRTADIERVLTIGVQGPKVLHLLVLGPNTP